MVNSLTDSLDAQTNLNTNTKRSQGLTAIAPQFPRCVYLRSIKPGVLDISRNRGFCLPVSTGGGRRPGCGCPLVVRLRISNAHGALSTGSQVGACLGPVRFSAWASDLLWRLNFYSLIKFSRTEPTMVIITKQEGEREAGLWKGLGRHLLRAGALRAQSSQEVARTPSPFLCAGNCSPPTPFLGISSSSFPAFGKPSLTQTSAPFHSRPVTTQALTEEAQQIWGDSNLSDPVQILSQGGGMGKVVACLGPPHGCFLFLIYLLHLFIFGCVGSSLLRAGFF